MERAWSRGCITEVQQRRFKYGSDVHLIVMGEGGGGSAQTEEGPWRDVSKLRV